MKKQANYGYNERLFSGPRKHIHLARFHWLAKNVATVGASCKRVVELGAFDGKTIDFLPSKPERYLGLDANWEGGLDMARKRWSGESDFTFRECHSPIEMHLDGEMFDLAICMDTLEHVPPELVEPYLAELAAAVKGYIFISVPNEKGLVFCLKHLVKLMMRGDVQHYSLSEFYHATLGRMECVARNEHKGFDYNTVIRSVSRYYTVCGLTGYPFAMLSPWLNFGVGIIGRKL